MISTAPNVQDFANYANSFGTGFLKEHKAATMLAGLDELPAIYMESGRLNRWLDNALKMEGFNDAAISCIQEWLEKTVLPQKTHHFHVSYKTRNGRRVTRDFDVRAAETTEPKLRADAISRFSAVGFVENLHYVNFEIREGKAPVKIVTFGKPAKATSRAVTIPADAVVIDSLSGEAGMLASERVRALAAKSESELSAFVWGPSSGQDEIKLAPTVCEPDQ